MSNPLPTPPRAPHTRPPLPALQLAVPPRRLGPGALVALAAHIALIGALIWERTTYLQRSMGEVGPQGGGRGGGEQLRYVALQPAAPPAIATPRASVTEAPLPVPLALKLPEPTTIDVTPAAITPPAITVAGTGGGPGAVSGTGGAPGTTTGTGTGSSDGPGSGGDGGYIVPPDPKAALLPPDCVRGRYAVLLSVEANGRVSRVELDPQPKDASCRREFIARMRGYEFRPATRDGRPVASVFNVTIEH